MILNHIENHCLGVFLYYSNLDINFFLAYLLYNFQIHIYIFFGSFSNIYLELSVIISFSAFEVGLLPISPNQTKPFSLSTFICSSVQSKPPIFANLRHRIDLPFCILISIASLTLYSSSSRFSNSHLNLFWSSNKISFFKYSKNSV